MKIGFIGAGKVGCSLGKYLSLGGLEIVGYQSRSFASAREAAAWTGSRAFAEPLELLKEADLLFLSVPDGAISTVWLSLHALEADIQGKIFAHLSGSLSSALFEGAQERGAEAVSLHPLMAVPDRRSHELLAGAVFTVEGSAAGASRIASKLAALGNSVFPLPREAKTLYHCAASFVSNFAVALAHVGGSLFDRLGLGAARPALFGLMLANAKSVAALGPVQALTGPVERGDADTVRAHLEALSGSEKEIYRLLAQRLVEIARAKRPETDYAPLAELLLGPPLPPGDEVSMGNGRPGKK
ncbi:MAG: DUF2520 domain-containing protein [Deltaproteobacteria bacterium]|jgi:predicted short-subunit dehydrogenase-like oxidoreductase (DUF2520 family)|nr:DUF2520 domain-containing protein [Deltaproteobacteria bacterium]